MRPGGNRRGVQRTSDHFGTVIREWPRFQAALNFRAAHESSTAIIKVGADYGFDETDHTCKGRRGDGNGRRAALVCSAD
jgi:hypothetical protein